MTEGKNQVKLNHYVPGYRFHCFAPLLSSRVASLLSFPVELLRSFLILLYWSICGAAFPISSFTVTSFSFLSSLELTLPEL